MTGPQRAPEPLAGHVLRSRRAHVGTPHWRLAAK
jgi:hypothetical protein